MKLSNVFLLSAVLMLGTSFAAAQSWDGYRWNDGGAYQTIQYHDGADYQRGYQDGINSGRADANEGKRFRLDSHPYYTNSNNQAYREGFAHGYREAYGHDRDNDGRYNEGYNGQYDGRPDEYGRANVNNGDYQRGYQDGINSGRADANDRKRPDVEAHPYYRNSNNQAYREGFMHGYREGYGQDRGNRDPYYPH